jgi:streptogramin lyase
MAFVVQAPTTLTGNVGGHNLVDVGDPKSPVASDDMLNPNAPTSYPVTAVPGRGSIAFPATQGGQLSVTEMKLQGNAAVEVQTIPVGAAQTLAYGVTADPDGRVLVAVPTEHYVAVVDLDAATAFMVPWDLTQSGPNDIKVVP